MAVSLTGIYNQCDARSSPVYNYVQLDDG